MIQSYTVTRGIEQPMRDSVLLAGDLWQPEGAQSRPALLFRTPYDRRRLVSDFLSPQQAVEAGFAVLVQDCRGRFQSGGFWRPLMWQQEAEDTYDTVEWIARQPWCTGAVGMAGVSYSGIVQLAGAALRPPHLKAIAPAFASTATDELAETGGAFWLDHLFGWLCLMAVEWAQRRHVEGHPLTEGQWRIIAQCVHDPGSIMQARPLRSAPIFSLPDFPISFDELISAPATPDIDVGRIDVPILSVGGWYDLYVRGALGSFARSGAAAERHLLVGCWTHGGSLPACHGQVNFGLTASGAGGGVPEQHVAFFRRYLCDESVEVPRIRYFVMGTGQWRTADEWPPPHSELRRLYLNHAADAPSARLTEQAPDNPGSFSYCYDPASPTPTLGGRLLGAGALAAGPFDQRHLAARPDVLVYDSPPFDGPVELLGPATAVLHVSSTSGAVDVVTKLIDVAPDGLALPITDGIVRRGRADGAGAAGDASGDPEPISIAMADTAWRIEPGHRLRLQVQSANYPHIDANPNTAAACGVEGAGGPVPVSIWHGGASASYLEVRRAEVR